MSIKMFHISKCFSCLLIEIPNATSKNNLVALTIANVGGAFSSAKFFSFHSFIGVIILLKVVGVFFSKEGKYERKKALNIKRKKYNSRGISK
ncbi:MAG: hypothetical protein PHD05_09280 [Sphaerochaetaceae bacterium]|nr:hypothetical protein [Sphaerochaetaceae bacterium]